MRLDRQRAVTAQGSLGVYRLDVHGTPQRPDDKGDSRMDAQIESVIDSMLLGI